MTVLGAALSAVFAMLSVERASAPLTAFNVNVSSSTPPAIVFFCA